MAIQTFTMDWGTWLKSTDTSAPSHEENTYMEVGYSTSPLVYKARPLIKFTYTGIAGTILSAALKFYVSSKGGSPLVQAWRVTRLSGAKATWLYSPNTAWYEAGCENMNNDRYQTPLTGAYRINSTGWWSFPITNLTQLQLLFDGLQTLLLREDSTYVPPAVIEKSPAPYLEITYQSTLVGGVQII